MSLIMGLNLTDRIILAGDTKVTDNDTGQTLGYCIKVIQFRNEKHNSFVSCAFAGNKHFSKYLAEEIHKAIESGELDTDINFLVKNIDDFFKKIVPRYTEKEKNKNSFMIFGGVSRDPKILKPFDGDRFTKIFGPEGGKVNDENLLFAMQTDFMALPIRDQKIFSYKIKIESGGSALFGLGSVGGVYSFLFGGSTKIETEIQQQIQRIFLDKRSIEDESRDVINLIRNKYSKTIGGAITIGVIDNRGRLIFVGYDLDRSGEEHQTNWSVRYGKSIIGIGPDNKEVDLIAGFYDDMSEKHGFNLEL